MKDNFSILNIINKFKSHTVQEFGVGANLLLFLMMIMLAKVFFAYQTLHLVNHKYSKNCNIVKYYYNLI